MICFTHSEATSLKRHPKCSCTSCCLSSLPTTWPRDISQGHPCTPVPFPDTKSSDITALPGFPHSHISILFWAPWRAAPSLCLMLQRPRAGLEKLLALPWEKPWAGLGRAAEMRPWLCRHGVTPGLSSGGVFWLCPISRQGWSEATRPDHRVCTHWRVTSKGALGCSHELLLPLPPPPLLLASMQQPATLDLLRSLLTFYCSKPGPQCFMLSFSLFPSFMHK